MRITFFWVKGTVTRSGTVPKYSSGPPDRPNPIHNVQTNELQQFAAAYPQNLVSTIFSIHLGNSSAGGVTVPALLTQLFEHADL